MLDERWVFHGDTEAVKAGEGVVRRVFGLQQRPDVC